MFDETSVCSQIAPLESAIWQANTVVIERVILETCSAKFDRLYFDRKRKQTFEWRNGHCKQNIPPVC